jgi:membrane protease YdiL (CAAX protease family)
MVVSWIRRQPLVAFFGLACALSWWPSLVQPHGILPLGPLVAALLLLPIAGGSAALLDFVRRIARWRVRPVWYAVVLGLPPAVALLALGIGQLLGAAPPTWERAPTLASLVPTFFMIFLLIGLGEEPAWRGVALPRLVRRYGLAGGVLALAGLHIVWHLPLFGREYDQYNGPPWALSVAAYTAITAWMYARTDGNLLLPALMHTAVNTSAKFLMLPLFQGSDMLEVRWAWAALWVLAAVGAVVSLARDPGYLRGLDTAGLRADWRASQAPAS